MYTNITRKKNAYTFHFPNGQVVIDLDKREEPIIGVSGKALKGAPRNVVETRLGSAIYQLYQNGYGMSQGLREVVDRCISLGLKPESIDNICKNNTYIDTNKILEKKTWKKIISYIRENEDNINHWNLANILEELTITNILNSGEYTERVKEATKKFINRYSLNYFYSNNIDIIDFLKNLKPIFADAQKYEEELVSFKNLIKTNTTPNFRNFANISYTERIDYDDIFHKLVTDYVKYYRILKKWNLPKESGSFYKKYEVAKKIDREYSNRPSDEIFRLRQESREFAYEDDKVIVEVPKTREECEEIGKEFHNCVGGWEWNCRLSNGSANLVVIREKGKDGSTNKVCCDIIDGVINQYYAPCNRCNYSEVLSEFKTVYQNYLNSLYNN